VGDLAIAAAHKISVEHKEEIILKGNGLGPSLCSHLGWWPSAKKRPSDVYASTSSIFAGIVMVAPPPPL